MKYLLFSMLLGLGTESTLRASEDNSKKLGLIEKYDVDDLSELGVITTGDFTVHPKASEKSDKYKKKNKKYLKEENLVTCSPILDSHNILCFEYGKAVEYTPIDIMDKDSKPTKDGKSNTITKNADIGEDHPRYNPKQDFREPRGRSNSSDGSNVDVQR